MIEERESNARFFTFPTGEELDVVSVELDASALKELSPAREIIGEAPVNLQTTLLLEQLVAMTWPNT
jgi:hypothetical protein